MTSYLKKRWLYWRNSIKFDISFFNFMLWKLRAFWGVSCFMILAFSDFSVQRFRSFSENSIPRLSDTGRVDARYRYWIFDGYREWYHDADVKPKNLKIIIFGKMQKTLFCSTFSDGYLSESLSLRFTNTA